MNLNTGTNAEMKKRRTWIRFLGGIALVILSALILGFTFPSSALAWDDCPYGEVDCVYPGDCPRYVDTNADGICDRSQPEPTIAGSTTDDLAVLTTDSASEATGSTTSHGGGRGHRSTLVASAESVTATTSVATAALVDQGAISTDSGGLSFSTHYFVSPIALIFLLVYLASFLLYKTKRIKMATHRKTWNVLLLATFLITGIFGLILTVELDYELPFRIPIDLLFWHVEAGIVMSLISLFHIGWHFNYYRNLLRSRRSKTRAACSTEGITVYRTSSKRQPVPIPELSGNVPGP